jgi:hypothetical protein
MIFISLGSERPVVAISCPPSARPPVAALCVEAYVGRMAFFGLFSFVFMEPMLAAT